MQITTHRAIGYIRVSTDKQEIGPEVQAETLTHWAASQDTEIDLRREDAASAKSLKGRPILARALADLKAGRADVLVVSKLDRLSRSVADFARILEDAEHQGWSVVCLDLSVDTRTVTGRAMAHVVATFAQMERERIGERTREGMAKIKAETGKHMGRPVTLTPATADRIRDLHESGLSLQGICSRLTADAVPTATGGQWWPATVRGVLERTA
jgi:DNA invertase Pin-like site-specific DNA recombinase